MTKLEKKHLHAKTFFSLLAVYNIEKAVEHIPLEENCNQASELSDKSIACYENYKKAIAVCPFNPLVINHLRLNYKNYSQHIEQIVWLGVLVQYKNAGTLSEFKLHSILLEAIKQFSLNKRDILKTFLIACTDFYQVEKLSTGDSTESLKNRLK
jgi:hypothetical protein